MKYLLDVSSLISFGVRQHRFHARVAGWLHAQTRSAFYSCSITELGFVRILSNASEYGFSLGTVRALLRGLKEGKDYPIRFIADGNDISLLPSWVKFPGQTTDGHLAQLARSHGAILATLDTSIPDTFLIP